MLAGVLLPLCAQVVTGLKVNPWSVAPVVVVWVAGMRYFPQWAVPEAFGIAVAVLGVQVHGIDAAQLLPHLELVSPRFSVAGLIAVALPLFIVTMASQHLPGVAVLKAYGYEANWRASMLVTGLGSALAAAGGGLAVNLAAISAALASRCWAHLARPSRALGRTSPRACRSWAPSSSPRPASPFSASARPCGRSSRALFSLRFCAGASGFRLPTPTATYPIFMKRKPRLYHRPGIMSVLLKTWLPIAFVLRHFQRISP